MEGRGQTAALLPAAGLLIFALYCGTFAGGASAGGAIVAHAILWLAGFSFVILVATSGRRRESVGGGWLSGAVFLIAWAGVALPWWASPVPRAGASAIVLVAVFLILPWLVARCWRLETGTATRAQRGVFGVGLVLAAVSARGLWGWLGMDTDGASMPLGHHNLLAAFLVTTLPLAALGWRSAGAYRWLAAASVGLGTAALLATRSLAGALALAAVIVVWGMSLRFRPRPVPRRSLGWTLLVAAGTVVGLGLVFGRRILDVVIGIDPSTMARLGYWRAGVEGIVERPLWGWGPGSTPWTVHEHFRPVPGVHPPDQVLADLHSLPLQLLYEHGFVGCSCLVLALIGSWILLRRRTIVDRGLVTAGLAGLVALSVASLAGLPLSVLAVPLAACLAGGAVLAGLGIGNGAGPSSWTPQFTLQAVGAGAALVLALAILVPQDQAHLAYQRAQRADSAPERLVLLERAVVLDPEFPLYRWRLALERDDPSLAREAAEQARSVAAPWLTAEAWDDVCRLSRLGTVAPFRASLERSEPEVMARALAAQPWLLAAEAWRGRERQVADAVALLVDDPRIEIGWRARLRDVWVQIRRIDGHEEAARLLVLDLDAEPATSLSLHTFRRSPWPARIGQIRLDGRRLGPVADMPAAVALTTTEASLFRSPSCAIGR